MAAGGAAVVTNVVTNIVIAFLCYFAFSFLRISNFARLDQHQPSAEVLKPTRLPNTVFGWPVQVWTYPEEAIIDESGLDTAMYLRLHSFGLEVFMWVSLWCLIVVLPTNLVGTQIYRLLNGTSGSPPPPNGQPAPPAGEPRGEAQTFTFTTFDMTSLANVETGSPVMWVHLVSVYVVSLIVLKLLWRYSKESVLLRLMFIANSPPGGPSHTVLVTDIPGIVPTHASIKLLAKVTEGLRRPTDPSLQKGGAGSSAGSAPLCLELVTVDEDSVALQGVELQPAGAAGWLC
ncbi:MAG: hypothetical protein WDW38_009605 [Sanguina aurantia]